MFNMGGARCGGLNVRHNVPGLGAVTKTCCLYIQLPLQRMCCSVSPVLASIYSEIGFHSASILSGLKVVTRGAMLCSSGLGNCSMAAILPL